MRADVMVNLTNEFAQSGASSVRFIGLIFSLYRIPLMIAGGVAGIGLLCGCAKLFSCLCCRSCSWRRCCCGCCKRLLRCTGWDKFDDFEVMLYVHEVSYEGKHAKMSTKVRIVAGEDRAETDLNSKGIYQQSFEIQVMQGTEYIRFDFLDSGGKVLAELKLNVLTDVLGKEGTLCEETYLMKVKRKSIAHPKLKLTMKTVQDDDAESSRLVGNLLQGQIMQVTGEQQFLLRQQLEKAEREADEKGMELSQEEVLKQACSGPLEIFKSLGRSRACFAAVLGPPRSRRWAFGIWNDQKEYDAKKPANKDIDILKIRRVEADPTRANVFHVQYRDQSQVEHTLTLRRVDRARDVWVDMLKLVITRAHEEYSARKKEKDETEKNEKERPFSKTGTKGK